MRFREPLRLPLGAALIATVMLAAPVARADGNASGPAADFPVTVGEPYVVGDTSFTPANAMNYDAVGYASIGEGAGATAAHHTLPLPSYVEVTALDTGKTVLVRVERRGPMQATNLIELSPAAAAQLGLGEGAGKAGVRVRRVNPPEGERAILRSGANAPDRMPTPKALLSVLARKLPTDGTVQLSSGAPLEKRLAMAAPPPAPAAITPKPAAAPAPKARVTRVAAAPAAAGAPFLAADPAPIKTAPPAKPAAKAKPAPRVAAADNAPPAHAAAGSMVVQAGAFSVKANAQTVARKLGAKLDPAGNLWRVRMGPFVNTADAEAALAKARAAGYTARIQRAE